MRHLILGFVTLTVAGMSNCIAGDGGGLAAIGPVHTVTAERGVVPPGTSLVVRTRDTVNTTRAYRSTVYLASFAVDVIDQNGAVLIPKESAVELGVRSLAYLGPGGAGMTLLTLDVHAITVGGVRYRVTAGDELPSAGGIGVERGAAKWIGGNGKGGKVVTRGRSIHVPTDTVVAFQIQDPIRLRGYQR